jgi:ADP-dependent NAD(P)H-hydrate dehydratase / NAD(P)H-hydrate epimerase
LRSLIPVVTSAEARAIDAATIAAGVPSRALMGRAGAAVASEIAMRYPGALRRGALVLAGPGNNGGDGWVVARALATSGVDVRVVAPEGARSADCIAEREIALPFVTEAPWKKDSSYMGEGVVVDALLGTGASGPVRGEIFAARAVLELTRRRGSDIVALDLPSGLDATTGETNDAVRADTTITFGTIKRGHLVARGTCGTIVVVDIGLAATVAASTLRLVGGAWIRQHLPPITADAHKGSRKKMLIHGGGPGMAGAVILAIQSALRSGIGMVKARVHPECVQAVHASVPAALVESWDDRYTAEWADVLVIGPGLGRNGNTRMEVENALRGHAVPVVLDADALNAFDGDLAGLHEVLAGRPALLTPHPLEMSRLVRQPVDAVLANRFDVGAVVAHHTGATVLLKGVPTVVTSPDAERLVVASGTPTLATAGSGDVLSGIAGTMLAQMTDALSAGATAAWIHGRAAELAGPRMRGTTLEDVIEMLPNAWSIDPSLPRYPVIAELPAVIAQ